MARQSPQPGTFWKVTVNWDADDVRHVESYEGMPDGFDFLELQLGKALPEGLPTELRLYLSDAAMPIADYLNNMFSWPIMSQRMLDCVWPLIEDCVEIFTAPLYERYLERPVEGWYVLNVVKVVDCIDLERSVTRTYKEDITGFNEICIDPDRTDGAHLFRYIVPQTGEVDYNNLICPHEIPLAMVNKGFKGIAFGPCQNKSDGAVR